VRCLELIAEDCEAILIGGLIKASANVSRAGVPGLGDVPLIGKLFRNSQAHRKSSETIVIITPHIVGSPGDTLQASERDRVDTAEGALRDFGFRMERKLDWPKAEQGR